MKKIFLIIGGVLVMIYLIVLIYVLSFSYDKNIPSHADAIIVFGARLNLDNSPSEQLYNRAAEAALLYKNGKADYIITTGGVGVGTLAESAVAKKIAIKFKVPENKVLSENMSHTTIENVAYIQALAKQHGINSVIIVSDQYHIARAAYVLNHFGFKNIYWDYPPLKKYQSTFDILYDYNREAIAMIWYVFKLA